MMLTVFLVNEDLERTMLEIEFERERASLFAAHERARPFVSQDPGLVTAFVPNGETTIPPLPAIFEGLQVGDSVEIERAGQTFMVAVDDIGEGVLYVAKNITHFEEREALFRIALVFIALAIMAFAWFFARLSSQRIVQPLVDLSEHISGIPVGPSMPRLQTDHADAELHAIALTFNRFLAEMEAYVRREQTMLAMASHELRTPVAVMSGGLDIVEARRDLASADVITLARMRRACDDMRDNVNSLLSLARSDSKSLTVGWLCVRSVVRRVIDDLEQSHRDGGGRIRLEGGVPLRVCSDAVMVHMLLRNLIDNAVQHTRGAVRIRVLADAIEIEDAGDGLSVDAQAILAGAPSEIRKGTASSGLGLYIVTLISERLGWKIDVRSTGRHGSCIRVLPSRSNEVSSDY